MDSKQQSFTNSQNSQTEGFMNYRPKEVEGQCLLKTIQCLRFNKLKFTLYVIISIIFVSVPVLLCYWYPKLKRWLYYDFCSIGDATEFYILNYDNDYTIVEKQFGRIHKNDISQQQTVFFVNRFLKYAYDNDLRSFQAVTYDFIPRLMNIVNQKDQIRGFDQEIVISLRQCFGKCAMQIPTPSCLVLFVREILQPFYIFILYSAILWYYQVYVYYASLICFISAIAIAINLFQVMTLNKKIFQMAFYQTRINVLRHNQVVETTSIDIVPGDIVFLKKSIKLPFDGILLGGSILMNQCALTGQSVPIVKKGIDKQQFNQKKIVDKSSLLYQGTQIVQICSLSRSPLHQQFEQFGLMVCVTQTNFSTIKGQLIRIISFPKGNDVKFYVESAKFVSFLFIFSITSFAILIAKLYGVVTTQDIVLKFFDLITITVPPALPASMTVGIGFSLSKLQKNGIFCISPNKVIPGGRIQHVCFDKTGTLTEDFMDFYEFVPKLKNQFLNPINLANRQKKQCAQVLKNNRDAVLALNNMASCHTIMNLENVNKLIGDPMEIKLFQFGNFKLVSNSSVSQNSKQQLFSFKGEYVQGTVFRRFQFNSEVQRMSAIASTTDTPNKAFIYCKGAPESMIKIMNPNGIPSNYNETLEKYTSCGFRVLAVASKPLNLNQVQNIDRENAQKNLEFNGFQVFENKLKPQTFGAIQTLKEAKISMVIITGDNVLTGANIGFKSGLIQKQKNIMICDLTPDKRVKVTNFYERDNNNENTTEGMVSEKDFNLKKIKTEPDFICSLDQLPNKASQIAHKTNLNYVFCVTGSLFSQIFNDNLTDEKKEFIKHIKVFARSKPNDKTRAVSVYQSLGKITAMCGDGANDCGALKQADAGLSLSQAQASIASPFTSKVPNIGSMITLITQCRGGLATNFSLFNIMALYSLIQYTTTIVSQYYFGYPSDLQFLYADFGHNFVFFLTIGYTDSLSKLSVLRPSDSLFSISNISCVFIMFAIQLVGQIGVILLMSNFPMAQWINYYFLAGQQINYSQYLANQGFVFSIQQMQAIFQFANFMYTFSVIAFSISYPWKKFFTTNIPFTIVLVIIFTYDVLIIIVPSARIPLFLLETGILPINYKFQGLLLGYSIGVGILMYVVQKFILEPLFNSYKEKHPENHWF